MPNSQECGRVIRGLALGATAVLLTACYPNLKPISDTEIQQLQANHSLEQKYQDLSKILEQAPDNKQARLSLDKIGKVLARDHYRQLQRAIDEQQNASGILPFAAQQGFDPLLQRLQERDPEVHSAALRLLQASGERRQRHIEQLTAQFNHTPLQQLSDKLALDEEIHALDSNADAQATRLRQLFADSRRQASEWLERKQFEPAVELLKQLVERDENPASHELYTEALFQQQLAKAKRLRQRGEDDAAYRIVSGLLPEHRAEQQRRQLQAVVSDLASHYNLMAQNSLKAGDLATTYSHLLRVHNLAAEMPIPDLDSGTGKKFANQIYRQAKAALDNQQWAHALAYTTVLADLQPMTAELKAMQEKIDQQLYERSVVKVASSRFDSPSNVPGLGGLITARLVERFLKEEQKDIRILERDKIDAVLKEQEIRALKGGGDVAISSADFLLHGAVVEANVDESSIATQETKRVVTDVTETPNPAYLAWQKLPKSERDKQPAPQRTEKHETQETVRYNVTQHRKLGSVTASFRIVTPSDAKLVHAESLLKERNYEGVSNEGVEIGLFVLPAQTARLPASNRILRELAQELADQIGDKLLLQLRNPEQRYLSQAKALQSSGDLNGATAAMGKAVSMLKAKGQAHQEQLQTLKLLALSSR